MELIIGKPVKITGRVEIARSFSYKLNAGAYESRIFFCSQKAECEAEEAEAVSALLYQFCKSQVLLAAAQYYKDLEPSKPVAAVRR